MKLASSLDIINEEEEYKVEEIRKHKKQEQGTQFLVYQKDYGDKHNQQITETEVLYAKEAFKDYWTRVSSQNL